MQDPKWKVKIYIEFELEAKDEEQAYERAAESIINELEESKDIRDIAEANAELIG